jgi:hypothetical protein
MKLILTTVLMASFLAAAPVAVMAAPCHDTKGKFVKCPPAPAAKKVAPVKCRDAKGKFIKCKA